MRIPPSGWSAVPSPNNHRSLIAFADETDADFDQLTSRRTNAASTQTDVTDDGAPGPSPKVRSARREAEIAAVCAGTETPTGAAGTELVTAATGIGLLTGTGTGLVTAATGSETSPAGTEGDS